MIKLRNLILFTVLALWHGTPFHLWSRAWQECLAEHQAQVHKVLWELKKRGLVYEDKEGRLFAKRRDK